MAQPLVQFDTIEGNCPGHQIPNPSSGAPQPTPGPLPFKAVIDAGVDTSVMIDGKAAAVAGSSGKNASAPRRVARLGPVRGRIESRSATS